MSDSLWPRGLQHARSHCPSPSPGVCPSSCPLHQWCHPAISSSEALFTSCPQFLPSIRDFSNGTALHIRWPKYWRFIFSICPSNEYSGLIFLRIDWVDLPAVQGTLKTLLQHHGSKASILQHSAFLHPFMTTGKTIALTIWIFVGKVMSLLFKMLYRFVIAALPKSKHLLISWLQSLSTVPTSQPMWGFL